MKTNKSIIILVVFLGSIALWASVVTKSERSLPNALKNDSKNGDELMKVDLNISEKTAVEIAEVILVSIYGKEVLEQRPWIITNNKTEFTIRGTLHSLIGGVAEISISKADARVIKYRHGK